MEGLGLGIQAGTQAPVGAMQEAAGTLEGPMQSALSSLESTAQNAFTGFVTGAMSAKEAVGQLLQSLAQTLANRAFQSLFGGFFGGGGFLGPLLSFDGGGFTGDGPRTGGVDGKGGFPAILHPNETVVDHTKGQGNGGGQVVIKLDLSRDVEARIMQNTSGQAVQIVSSALGANRQALPGQIDTISNRGE